MFLAPAVLTIAQDDQRWLASSHGTNTGDPVPVVVDTTTAATGQIPSGTLIAANGTINPDGTSNHAIGFLLTTVGTLKGAGTYQGVVIRHAQISDAMRVAKGLTALTTAQKTDLAANAEILIVA